MHTRSPPTYSMHTSTGPHPRCRIMAKYERPWSHFSDPYLEMKALNYFLLSLSIEFHTMFSHTNSLKSKSTTHERHKASSYPPELSTHPVIQPIKATLYFDNAQGFGDWRIFLNGRAIQNLREARRGDTYYFKSVIEIMRCVRYRLLSKI